LKVRLYNETPQHRDNFLKLVKEGYYNDLLFHRVIRDFMIQGGDPASRGAAPGIRLGGGGPGYTVPAELNPKFFHKKGALAAARTGDQVNPEKRSSGSQFYIVQGKVFRPGELDTLEANMNLGLQQNIAQQYFTAAQEELNKYRQENNQAAFEKRVAEIRNKADSVWQATPKIKLSAEQRQAYTTNGGTPHLDGGYTVFGEVVEGLEVIDKIASVQTDQNNRPVTDEKMQIEIIR
jgi:cyclophilin family peptidyl-prolyl cis-trans isomerase